MGASSNLLGELKRMQQRYEEAQRYYEESLQELRAVGYLIGCGGCAVESRLDGYSTWASNEAAFANFAEGLDLSRDLDFPHGIALTLLGAAGILARWEHAESAAKLIGAAAAIQESIGIVMVPSDEPDYASTIVELRAQLGQADFEQCWQTGHMMTAEEATALVEEFC